MEYIPGRIAVGAAGDKSAADHAEQVRVAAVFNQFREVMAATKGTTQGFNDYADRLFALAQQLPANKILEVKITDDNWTYWHYACRYRPNHAVWHYACRYRPNHAATLIDKFTPAQLYMRVNTNTGQKESPLKMALDAIENNNQYGEGLIQQIIERANPQDLLSRDGAGRTDLQNILEKGGVILSWKIGVIKQIIARARPEDLASTNDEGRTDLENIQRSSLPEVPKTALEEIYLKRLRDAPSAPAVVASASAPAPVTITDPREMVAALIANENATELDALNVMKALNAAFQKGVDAVAAISVSNRDTATAAVHAIHSLHNRVIAVEEALGALGAQPETIVLPKGIGGFITKIMRGVGLQVDPLKPALTTLSSARALADAATISAERMIEVQIGIAQNQDNLKRPFQVMEEALVVAIAHFAKREDDLGKRMHGIFSQAADNMTSHFQTMDRLAGNTNVARNVATEVVMAMQDMHIALNTLAVDIAELATLQTRRELRAAYQATGDAPILSLVRDRLKIAIESLKPAQQQLPALEHQVQEIVLTPLEAQTPWQPSALTPVG
jgi:hypothetical protein